MSLEACWVEDGKVYHLPEHEQDGCMVARCGVWCDQSNGGDFPTHTYIPEDRMGCKRCFPLKDVFRSCGGW